MGCVNVEHGIPTIYKPHHHILYILNQIRFLNIKWFLRAIEKLVDVVVKLQPKGREMLVGWT